MPNRSVAYEDQYVNPFTIRCTTCRRQLLVRSASVIGKLLTCPACGSMVMIEPPAEYRAEQGRATTVDSPGGSGSGGRRAAAAHSRGVQQQPPLTPVDPQQADTVAEELAEPVYQPGEVPQVDGADPSVHGTIGDPPPKGKTPQPQVTSCQPPATSPPGRPGWVSRESQLLRRWLMITAVGTAAALLIILSLGFWLGKQQAPRSPIAQNSPGANHQPAPKGVLSDSVGTDSVATEERTVGSGPTDPQPPPPASLPESPPAIEQKGDPQVQVAQAPRQENEKDAEGSKQVSSAPAVMPPANADPGGTQRPPTKEEAGGNLAPDARTEAGVAPGDLGRRAPSVSGALRDLEALAADAIVSPRALTGSTLYDLLPHPGRTFDAAGALPKPTTRRPVNANNQLAIQLPSLDFPSISLVQLCRFVQELTSVPVTLDVDSLQRAGISPDVPVAVAAKNEDLATVLRNALQPLQLEWRTDGTQVLVTAVGMDAVETVTYDVYDLVADDAAQQQQLQSWLENLVAPAAWQRHGGPGTMQLDKGRLQVTTTRAVQYEVKLFCERLRIARALRPQGKVPDYAAAQQLRLRPALDRLAQTVTVHEPIGAPLVKILDKIGSQADLTITVDWHGLMGEGWTPAALARLDIDDVPAAEALQQLLGPMRLAFRVFSANTVQVTTFDRAWKLEEIEFFPLEPFWQKDQGRQVLRRIRGLLSDSLDLSVGQARFVVDPASRTLIVAAPQYRIAQIAGLLERMAAPAEDAEPALPVLE